MPLNGNKSTTAFPLTFKLTKWVLQRNNLIDAAQNNTILKYKKVKCDGIIPPELRKVGGLLYNDCFSSNRYHNRVGVNGVILPCFFTELITYKET